MVRQTNQKLAHLISRGTSHVRNRALMRAVKKGNLRKVRHLVKDGASLGIITSFGNSLLHLAAWEGQPHIIRYLLRKGLNPDGMNYGGLKPIHAAAYEGHGKAFRELLEVHKKSRADIIISSHIAAKLGKVEILEILLREGLLENAYVQGGKNLLYQAILNGHKDAVIFLAKEAKLSLDKPVSSEGESASGIAYQSRNPEMNTEFLISLGMKSSYKANPKRPIQRKSESKDESVEIVLSAVDKQVEEFSRVERSMEQEAGNPENTNPYARPSIDFVKGY